MAINFQRMRGRSDLAAFLECGEDAAAFLADAAADDVFTKHEIPKRGRPNRVREVWEIKNQEHADIFKSLARTLSGFLVDFLPGFPDPAAHGYVRGRSTLTNASRHLAAEEILKADIRAFFRSINTEKVVETLKKTGMSEDAASSLTSVLVWDDHLPLGLHTSPVIANAICVPMDQALARLVPGGKYTRYADDLSFSGPVLPTRADVEAKLAHHGFQLAAEKWRLVRRGRGLWVTGLSLEDGVQPRVPKAMKRRIRQELYYVNKNGIDSHTARRGYGSRQSALNKIHGTIQYIRGIERDLGQRLQDQWGAMLAKESIDAALVATGPHTGREALFLIDESVVDVPGGRRLLLGLAIVEDHQRVRTLLADFYADLMAQPHPVTDVDRLEKEGLHWNALDHDDRTAAVEKLVELPFRGFVAYATLPSGKKAYAATYERVLRKLVENRLVRYAGTTVALKAEENSKVRAGLIPGVLSDAYKDLGTRGDRRPDSEPTCEIVSKKSDDALPLPDLLLAVVGEYARVEIQREQARQAAAKSKRKEKRLPGEQALRRYRKIEGKVRAVFDLDTGRVYSRRSPFEPWNP